MLPDILIEPVVRAALAEILGQRRAHHGFNPNVREHGGQNSSARSTRT